MYPFIKLKQKFNIFVTFWCSEESYRHNVILKINEDIQKLCVTFGILGENMLTIIAI